MSKLTIIFLLIISVGLQIKLWFRPDGIRSIMSLNREIEQKKIELNNLQARKNNLLNSIEQLKKNPEFIEEHARVIFGMIKKNEAYYRVIEIANENFIKQ